ncbi:unnamed protein product [Ixodes pacificus]
MIQHQSEPSEILKFWEFTSRSNAKYRNVCFLPRCTAFEALVVKCFDNGKAKSPLKSVHCMNVNAFMHHMTIESGWSIYRSNKELLAGVIFSVSIYI